MFLGADHYIVVVSANKAGVDVTGAAPGVALEYVHLCELLWRLGGHVFVCRSGSRFQVVVHIWQISLKEKRA
jgi:hypothetical protein